MINVTLDPPFEPSEVDAALMLIKRYNNQTTGTPLASGTNGQIKTSAEFLLTEEVEPLWDNIQDRALNQKTRTNDFLEKYKLATDAQRVAAIDALNT